jgi:nitrogen fixation NifU-like protein
MSVWDNLEELVNEEMKMAYSETTIEHAINPRNVGSLSDADGYARLTGSCGDTLELWLKVKNDVISHASFITDGCGTTIAAGSMITEMAKGKSIPKAQSVSQQDVLNALGGLPEESQHCALLAAKSLKDAIKDYIEFKKEPWRRAYKKY